MRCSIAHSCTTVLLRQVGLLLATNSSSGVWSWRQCSFPEYGAPCPLPICSWSSTTLNNHLSGLPTNCA
ncbi:unnamed protein product [Urochloa humidicola]